MRKADVLVAIGVGCLALGLDALLRERNRLRWRADDAESAGHWWRERAMTAEDDLARSIAATAPQSAAQASDVAQPAPSTP